MLVPAWPCGEIEDGRGFTDQERESKTTSAWPARIGAIACSISAKSYSKSASGTMPKLPCARAKPVFKASVLHLLPGWSATFRRVLLRQLVGNAAGQVTGAIVNESPSPLGFEPRVPGSPRPSAKLHRSGWNHHQE